MYHACLCSSESDDQVCALRQLATDAILERHEVWEDREWARLSSLSYEEQGARRYVEAMEAEHCRDVVSKLPDALLKERKGEVHHANLRRFELYGQVGASQRHFFQAALELSMKNKKLGKIL